MVQLLFWLFDFRFQIIKFNYIVQVFFWLILFRYNWLLDDSNLFDIVLLKRKEPVRFIFALKPTTQVILRYYGLSKSSWDSVK